MEISSLFSSFWGSLIMKIGTEEHIAGLDKNIPSATLELSFVAGSWPYRTAPTAYLSGGSRPSPVAGPSRGTATTSLQSAMLRSGRILRPRSTRRGHARGSCGAPALLRVGGGAFYRTSR